MEAFLITFSFLFLSYFHSFFFPFLCHLSIHSFRNTHLDNSFLRSRSHKSKEGASSWSHSLKKKEKKRKVEHLFKNTLVTKHTPRTRRDAPSLQTWRQHTLLEREKVPWRGGGLCGGGVIYGASRCGVTRASLNYGGWRGALAGL